jgi:hypothetical protein
VLNKTASAPGPFSGKISPRNGGHLKLQKRRKLSIKMNNTASTTNILKKNFMGELTAPANKVEMNGKHSASAKTIG